MKFKKLLSMILIIAMIVTSVPGLHQISFAEKQSVYEQLTLDDLLEDSQNLSLESSESTTGPVVGVAPSLETLLSGNLRYIDLTEEEKSLICSTFNLTDQEMTQPLLENDTVKTAIKFCSIAKTSKVPLKTVIDFSGFTSDDRKLNEHMMMLGEYQTMYGLNQIELDQVTHFAQLGYNLYASVIATFAAKVLNLPVESVIRDDLMYDGSIGVEENELIIEYENDQNLLKAFHLEASKVRSFSAYTETSIYDIYKVIRQTLKTREGGLVESVNQTTTNGVNATTDSTQNETLPGFTKEVTAPFAYNQNQNQVSPSNGSVVSTITPFSLPGRNGLDVNLSPVYNSTNAGVYDEGYVSSYRDEYSYTQFIVYAWEYVGLYTPTGEYLATVSNTCVQKYYTLEEVAVEFLVNWTDTSILERNDNYVIVQERTGEIYSTPVFETVPYRVNQTNQQTQTSKYNNLGLGWSWGLPSIETDSNTNARYLHLGDGQVYQITEFIDNGSTNLMNYPHQDLKFQDGSLYTQAGSNTDRKSVV